MISIISTMCMNTASRLAAQGDGPSTDFTRRKCQRAKEVEGGGKAKSAEMSGRVRIILAGETHLATVRTNGRHRKPATTDTDPGI